jgi:beta-fructofuranosidase
MNSQALRDARRYEEEADKRVARDQKPDFHLAARVGWMNDPNGFSYYNGKYHMFYQYHPYDVHWGPMHWGHAVSDDLLHWEHLPVALAPDKSYDRDGCFSGSAYTLSDGRQVLMYTGVEKRTQPDGEDREVQTQCLAIGDGVDYTKYSMNPVLNEMDLPEGGSKFDFRDPKVWQDEDGTYNCVVGNRPADGSGQILLFTSTDGLNWKYKSTLVKNNNRFGLMWECPDFFELDGKWVLLTSPQDMLPEELEYHNGNGTLCLIGDYDKEKGVFTPEFNQAIDYGIDFYAPQTIKTVDGRRVMIGWMQNWDTCNFRSYHHQWYGQMSLPRELHIENGRLIQKPLKELENMRTGKVSYDNVDINDKVISLDGIKGRKIDLELEIRPAENDDIYHRFAINFAQDDMRYTSLSFRPHENILKIDRKFSGSRRAIIHQRRCKVNSENGKLKLRIILDKFSTEIFVNDGEQVLTTTLYTDLSADRISFFADGHTVMNVVNYELE